MLEENNKIDKPIFELVDFCDNVFSFLEKNKHLLKQEDYDIDLWVIKTKSDFENVKSLFSTLYINKERNRLVIDNKNIGVMGNIFHDLSRIYKDCNDKLFLAKRVIGNKLENLSKINIRPNVEL